MTSRDDERALQRYVAGLDVDEDDLVPAVTARAVDRSIVADALIDALSAPESTVRLRAAERAARMAEPVPRVVAALTLAASTDVDLRVRAAAEHALRTHGLPGTGAAPAAPADETAIARARGQIGERIRSALTVSFRVVAMRGSPRRGASTILLVALERADAPARGIATLGDDGLWSIALTGLPAPFAGGHATLRLLDAAGEPTLVVTSGEPVTGEGSVVIVIPSEAGTPDETMRHLRGDIQLVAQAQAPQ